MTEARNRTHLKWSCRIVGRRIISKFSRLLHDSFDGLKLKIRSPACGASNCNIPELFLLREGEGIVEEVSKKRWRVWCLIYIRIEQPLILLLDRSTSGSGVRTTNWKWVTVVATGFVSGSD
jgi:hypothetical protein